MKLTPEQFAQVVAPFFQNGQRPEDLALSMPVYQAIEAEVLRLNGAGQGAASPWPDAPATIYLQVCEDDGCGENFHDHDVTWCEYKIHESDLKYVLASPPIQAAGHGPVCCDFCGKDISGVKIHDCGRTSPPIQAAPALVPQELIDAAKEAFDAWNSDPSDPTVFGARVDSAIQKLSAALPDGVQEIMVITDGAGTAHPIYGDDFVRFAIEDVLEKLKQHEQQEVQRNGYDA